MHDNTLIVSLWCLSVSGVRAFSVQVASSDDSQDSETAYRLDSLEDIGKCAVESLYRHAARRLRPWFRARPHHAHEHGARVVSMSSMFARAPGFDPPLPLDAALIQK